MYSLLETNLDIDQFLKSVYRYVQIGVHIRGYQDKNTQRFIREVCEVCEFFVNEDNKPESNIIYRKNIDGTEITNSPSSHLIDYLESQGIDLVHEKFDNFKIDLPFSDNQKKEEVNSNPVEEVINNQNTYTDEIL